MSDIINYLQHRVAEAKRDLQDADERMRQAMTDRDMLGAELQGYERALAAEMRRQGMGEAKVASTQETLSLLDSAETKVNKAELARKFICERADNGVTPADILKSFQDSGVPITKPYIYSLVQRLQNRKPPAIRLKRGKWYPVPESEQPANAA